MAVKITFSIKPLNDDNSSASSHDSCNPNSNYSQEHNGEGDNIVNGQEIWLPCPKMQPMCPFLCDTPTHAHNYEILEIVAI